MSAAGDNYECCQNLRALQAVFRIQVFFPAPDQPFFLSPDPDPDRPKIRISQKSGYDPEKFGSGSVKKRPKTGVKVKNKYYISYLALLTWSF